MNDTIRFLIIFALLWLVQGAGIYFQNKMIRKKMAEYQKNGQLYVGMSKNKFGSKTYAFVGIDNNGKINKAEALSGLTYFSKFRDVHDVYGMPAGECKKFLSETDETSLKKYVKLAISDAINKYDKGLLRKEVKNESGK